MITEKCQCGNVVEGSFEPSDTRKILTSIAKAGGMKAVLTYAGWVIPGFGNVAGFVTGAAIDIIYGKDINKLIDKIADALEKKKIYAFSCPKCGNSWTRTMEGDDGGMSEEIYDGADELTSVLEENRTVVEACFNLAKDYHILSDEFRKYASAGCELAKEMSEILLGLMDEKGDELGEEEEEELVNAMSDFDFAGSDFLAYIVENCKGSMDNNPNPATEDFEKPFSMDVFGAYPMFFSETLMLVGVVQTGAIKVNEDISLPNKFKLPVSRICMFGKDLPQAEAGDVCAIVIPNSYTDATGNTVALSIEEDKFKVTGDSLIQSPPILSGSLTSNEEEYLTEYRACLEEDGVITDRERRLLDRIRKSLGISEERARELEESCSAPSLSEEEQEYADEIKACLEEDGKISDRERRLLNKLRVSLGISEERAKEIETLVK